MTRPDPQVPNRRFSVPGQQRAISEIFQPAALWSKIAVRFASGIRLLLVPGGRPNFTPLAFAAVMPAIWRSLRTSVSYAATLARTFAIKRPAGVDRSSPSRSEMRLTLRWKRSSNSAVSPLAVRPRRSRRQTVSVETLPAAICRSRRLNPGRSITLPVKLSRYHSIGSVRVAAQRLRSCSWLATSCDFELTRR